MEAGIVSLWFLFPLYLLQTLVIITRIKPTISPEYLVQRGHWGGIGIGGIRLKSCQVLATIPSQRLFNIRGYEWLADVL